MSINCICQSNSSFHPSMKKMWVKVSPREGTVTGGKLLFLLSVAEPTSSVP